MTESKPAIKEPQNQTIDPLEDEIREKYAKEWDEISGRPNDPKKGQYVEDKTWETFDTADLIRKKEHEGEIDHLTGLPTRKIFEQDFQRLQSLMKRGIKMRVTIVRVDLDDFKAINDGEGGHKAGDETLICVSAALRLKRATDQAYRESGDEFLLLLEDEPQATEQESSTTPRIEGSNQAGDYEAKTTEFLNHLGVTITKTVAANTGIQNLTASMGFTEVKPGMTSVEAKHQADIALYHSKENGRNQVTAHKRGMTMPQEPQRTSVSVKVA